jgi:hypothetical protein
LSDTGSPAWATELAMRAAPQSIARKTRFMEIPVQNNPACVMWLMLPVIVS